MRGTNSGTFCPRDICQGGQQGHPLKGVCPVCPATPGLSMSPCQLTVEDTMSLHDGEVAHWWAWGEASAKLALAPGPAAESTHHKRPEFPFLAGGTDQPGEPASVDRAGSTGAINRNIGGGAS